MGEMPDTIGSFLGLITREGRVRYQMRTEETSITGLSYKGDFELPGGKVRETDLRNVLTLRGLLGEAIRETKEELGIEVSSDFIPTTLYRTVFENPKTGKVDWAFVIMVSPGFWDEDAETKRKIVDLDPDDLDVLGRLNLIVSGKKRMWRMGEASLYMYKRAFSWCRAGELLTEVKPDWKETELFIYPHADLEVIRLSLGLD